MARTYSSTPVLSKVKIGDAYYYLKDADARGILDSIDDDAYAALQLGMGPVSGNDGKLVSAANIKSYVDSAIAALPEFDVIVLGPSEDLPTASAETWHKIYLKPAQDAESRNIYIEYITVRQGTAPNYTYSWEKVGDTAIDLSGYVTDVKYVAATHKLQQQKGEGSYTDVHTFGALADADQGEATVSADPTNNLDVATKRYVDNKPDLVEITWSALKALRDGGTLIPGRQYRITDYTCTTSTYFTTSAGHQFDIIVTADSAAQLNEKARAILHLGDTYFANNKLEAWELWYSLDNDTAKFAWADNTNGKGVIYRMIDEFGNDCPYDFKNMLYQKTATFKLFQTSYGTSFYGLYGHTGRTTTISGTVYYHHALIERTGGPYNPPNEIWTTTLTYSTLMSLYQIDGTTVTTYGATITGIDTTNYQAYTFTSYSADILSDMSISYGKCCYGNIIKPLFTIVSNVPVYTLNEIFFRLSPADYLYKNTFEYNCKKMIFSGTAYYGNKFGYGCQSNTFGDVFKWNILGDNVYNNTFGNRCTNNVIGGDFYNNKIGAYFQYNIIGNSCSNNMVGTNVQYNIFGNDVYYISIGSSIGTDIYVRYCKFDSGVMYLTILSDDTSATSSNWIQYVYIHGGVKGSSSSNRRAIYVPDRNLSYSIDYYANNSQTIILD